MRTVITILIVLILGLAIYLVSADWWPIGHGSVVVTSSPPGAQVWADLNPTNITTDGTLTGLSNGKHSITVKLDTLLADPFAHVVEIRGGRLDTIHFTLRTPRGELLTHKVGERLLVAPKPFPVTTSPDSAQIPTAAEVRGSAVPESIRSAADLNPVITKQPLFDDVVPLKPPNEPVDISMPVVSPEVGAIEISSSEAGAAIYVNDREIAERTPATITMPFGTYTIRVELEGSSVSPEQHSVRVSRAAASQSVHFTLNRTAQKVRAFTVQTTPVEGRIFVDGDFVGEGAATVNRDYGTYVVTFGDIDGWRPPALQRVTLTPTKPQEQVRAKYERLFHASAQVNGEDVVALEGIERWSTGIIFERGKPQASSVLGPKIKPVPDSKKFGWELGMGDPNRNPTGGDYVLFSFTLPEDVPPETPLNLRLYVYKSSQRYPFSLAGRSEIVVEINGRNFLDGFTPRHETAAADLDRYEEWSLHHTLRPGDNLILLYTGDGNTVFNYLWKLEIQ